MNDIGRYIAASGIAGSLAALSITLTIIGAVVSVVVSRVDGAHSWRNRVLLIARTTTLVFATSACLAGVFVVQTARRTAMDAIIPSHALAAGSYAMRGDAVSLYPLVQHSLVPVSLSKFRVAESFLVAMDSQLFVLSALPVECGT